MVADIKKMYAVEKTEYAAEVAGKLMRILFGGGPVVEHLLGKKITDSLKALNRKAGELASTITFNPHHNAATNPHSYGAQYCLADFVPLGMPVQIAPPLPKTNNSHLGDNRTDAIVEEHNAVELYQPPHHNEH